MSVTAQKLLALFFFIVGMAIFGRVWWWVVYDLTPDWFLNLFFYGIYPFIIVPLGLTLIWKNRRNWMGRKRGLRYWLPNED